MPSLAKIIQSRLEGEEVSGSAIPEEQRETASSAGAKEMLSKADINQRGGDREEVMKAKLKGDSVLVVVKVRGVAVDGKISGWLQDRLGAEHPSAKRAKFAAARQAGVLADYVPTRLSDLDGANINELMRGEWVGEIVNTRIVENDIVQDTVLYGVRLEQG